eukprot:TRINITY_DN27218_c0_g1_i1.p1 TRINITY_DN27218_c0_g1~~TRINITY_DN27218_c0_g1_i1.p1  ORF type:complete len:308 (+),score=106.50 TRINITY_DN27218_c0_g1_i1:130-1053(+)
MAGNEGVAHHPKAPKNYRFGTTLRRIATEAFTATYGVQAKMFAGAALLGYALGCDWSNKPIELEIGPWTKQSAGRIKFTAPRMREFMRAVDNVLHQDEEVACMGTFMATAKGLRKDRYLDMGCVHDTGSAVDHLRADFGLAFKAGEDGLALQRPKIHPGGICSIDAAALTCVNADDAAPRMAALPPPLAALPPRYFIHGTKEELRGLQLAPNDGANKFVAYLGQDALLAAGLCSLTYGIHELEFVPGQRVRCVARDKPEQGIMRGWDGGVDGDRADPGMLVTTTETEIDGMPGWIDWSSSSKPYYGK